ncbi:MAG TPA: hypothetical protein VHS99_08235 [Chloroflexota bacterium]|jgi:hypothetical protein|nr:hypothetical protein [Chloroflexota bacterium]
MRIGMARLNITIPDDLAAALDQYRSRLNLSQICAHALRQEVQKMEALDRGRHDLQKLIERLRSQKRLVTSQWFEAGAEAAAAWIERADYWEIRKWGEWEPQGDRQRFYGDFFNLPPAQQRRAREIADAVELEGQIFDWAAYAQGWHQHVRDVWVEIKEQL